MATKKKASTKRTTSKAAKPAKRAAPAKARKAKAPRRVAAIPKGYHTATPYLVVRGASDAIAFYVRAFGAKEKVCMRMPNGTVMHAEVQVGDSMIMLSEENPQWGSKSPLTLGGSATHVMLYVRDVDAFVARALAAGATVEMPIANMFWGDRYGKIRDPFGHQWSIGTHIEDLTPKETQRRADIEMAKMMQPPAA